MGEKTKKQHWVPQSYLLRFCNSGEQINTYDKFSARSYATHVKAVAQESCFYDIPEEVIKDIMAKMGSEAPEIDPQTWEQGLSVFDGYLNRTIEDLLVSFEQGGTDLISDETGEMMAFFLALQAVRTKTRRNQIVDLRDKLYKKYLEKVVELRFPEHKHLTPTMKFSDPEGVTYHADEFFNIERLNSLANGLLNHIWVVGINQSDQSFLTSDNPVVRHSHLYDPLWSHGGLLSEGIEIAYPLTPNCILLLFENTYFELRRSWHRTAMAVGAEDVARYNEMQVLQSYRHVFTRLNDFDAVTALCGQHPEVCSPNRNYGLDKEIEAAVDQMIKENPVPTLDEFNAFKKSNPNWRDEL